MISGKIFTDGCGGLSSNVLTIQQMSMMFYNHIKPPLFIIIYLPEIIWKALPP